MCPTCKRTIPLQHVWIATEYLGLAKELVRALKFGYKRQAASIMAHYMQDVLPLIDEQTLIVPIPTAATRVRQRGFDQTRLIALELSKHTGLEQVHCLRRMGKTRQVGAKRTKRLKQLEDALWVADGAKIRGRKILLIDDVVTTGATITAAAKTLKQAGAKSVGAIVFAQTK